MNLTALISGLSKFRHQTQKPIIVWALALIQSKRGTKDCKKGACLRHYASAGHPPNLCTNSLTSLLHKSSYSLFDLQCGMLTCSYKPRSQPSELGRLIIKAVVVQAFRSNQEQ